MTTIARPGYQFQLFMRTSEGTINWRLLSGNNREAGRGTVAYSDIDQCRQAIADLQVKEPDLVGRVRRTELNRWLWQLSLGEQVVAVASRPADRLIRCEGALAVFRASLSAAVISPTVVMTEARRWRTAR